MSSEPGDYLPACDAAQTTSFVTPFDAVTKIAADAVQILE